MVVRLKLGHERHRSVWFLEALSGPSRGIDTPLHARLLGEPDQGRSADGRAPEELGTRASRITRTLYADPNLAEGIDYARRHRRHERLDDTLAGTDDVPKTTILAPHGAGSSAAPPSSAWPWPATTRPTCPRSRRPGSPTTIGCSRASGRAATPPSTSPSTGCDHGVAISLCAGSLNGLVRARLRPGARVPPRRAGRARGGANLPPHRAPPGRARRCRHQGAQRRHGELDGDDPCNIVNRTLLVAPEPPAAPGRRAVGSQHPAARRDVHPEHPRSPQAHHHPAVLDLRGGVPRRARPARGRAEKGPARVSLSRSLTVLFMTPAALQ